MGPLVDDKVTLTEAGEPLRPFENSDDRQKSFLQRHGKAFSGILFAVAAYIFAKFDQEAEGRAHGNASASGARHSNLTDADDVNVHRDVADNAHRQKSGGYHQTSDDFNVIRLPLTSMPSWGLNFDDDEPRITLRFSTGIEPSNDNETLYEAPPGSGVSLGGGVTSGGAGGRSGSSGNPPQSTGSNTNNGDDSNEETDDPEDTDTTSNETTLNRRPETNGFVRLPSQPMNYSVLISISALLSGATDADGDELTVVLLAASSGSLMQLNGNQWIFTPERGDSTDVTFSYGISDGAAVTIQYALMDLVPPDDNVIVGTEGDDLIVGTPAVDIIDARGGDDIVIGRNSDDVIYGRDGNDRIVSGDGDDIIFAGAGNDIIFAGAGDDIVFGGSGNDTLIGEGGDDTLFGDDGDDSFIAVDGDGDDVIDGGAGFDTYVATSISAPIAINLSAGVAEGQTIGTDRLINVENVIGGAGNDVIVGDDNSNRLDGGDGDDVLSGGAGSDAMSGGDGDDVFLASSDDGDDVVNGNSGSDTYSAAHIDTAVAIRLAFSVAEGEDIGRDTLINIENAVGGTGDDVIVGDDNSNRLDGGAGNDAMTGGGGIDHISGDDGDDTLRASADHCVDYFDGGDGTDTYSASGLTASLLIDLQQQTAIGDEIGDDYLESIENAVGGLGDDIIIASEAVNVLTGGGGDDIFIFEGQLSHRGRGSRDIITDFEVGDRIDIRQLVDGDSADTLDDLGFRRFVLINQGEDFTEPGQIRFRYDIFDDRKATIIEGNLDDELSEHEFEIELFGRYELNYQDFYELRERYDS